MFIRAANPIWFMVDLVGLPLNDQFFAFFLTNTLPYLPQNVYRDPQGLTVWTGDVVQFLPNGTLPDNLYFDPSLVYRIEIRQGNSQTDPLIYEINNFVPGNGATPSNNSLAILGMENLTSNPNFAEVFFTATLTSITPSMTITVAGTYEIAPGWELVLTGNGTTILTQQILSGDQNQINSPAYALRVNNSGWTEAFLRQRFNQNGALWANGAVSMSVTIRAQTSPSTVSLIYSPNVPGVPALIATGLVAIGDYQVLAGAVDLPASVNSTISTTAFIDMIIQLAPTGTVDVTNVQILGQSSPLPTNFNPLTDIPTYKQESEERSVDHFFHTYRDELIDKPKKSLLCGWNFPINPYQFRTQNIITVTSQTSYICDQTILHQEAASQLQTGVNVSTEREDLLVKAVTGATTTRFALIQYIAPETNAPYWSYILSSLARARIFTVNGTQVRLKARLIYRVGTPSTISPTEPISSWPANSDPVFSAGWTAIAPLNDPAYILPNAYSPDESPGGTAYPGFPYNQFPLPLRTNSIMTLGIVIYTMDNLNSTLGSEDSIGFDKISLIPSKFAADAFPNTFDEEFRACQFYYEKSYDRLILPGTATESGKRIGANQLMFVVAGTQYNADRRSIPLIFQQTKQDTPTVTFYSPSGNINNVRLNVDSANTAISANNLAISDYQIVSENEQSILLQPVIAGAVTSGAYDPSLEVTTQFQYTADSRLGR